MRHKVFFAVLGLLLWFQAMSVLSLPNEGRMNEAGNNALDDNIDEAAQEEYRYFANPWDRLLAMAQKRSCIGIDRRCDNRPNGCCYNTACRCSVFGSNCRCQRMGLFQIWGRK